MYSPTYEKRIQSLSDQLIDTKLLKGLELHAAVKANCQVLKDNRHGGYLIKRNSDLIGKLMCQWGSGYIDYTFKGDKGAWSRWGNRSNAQWFTKQEIKEFLDNFPKWFKVVKR